ncbi:zinc ribbon domain-containing protein [Parasphingorhabdus sp.]|uniref:zinc ribbon domain-containing protein n=1 Tax=Parasphingorhabdus sp. TaxID=2709688 RepID=UPI003FA6CC27
MIHRCQACGYRVHPPTTFCPACESRSVFFRGSIRPRDDCQYDRQPQAVAARSEGPIRGCASGNRGTA